MITLSIITLILVLLFSHSLFTAFMAVVIVAFAYRFFKTTRLYGMVKSKWVRLAMSKKMQSMWKSIKKSSD